MADRIVVMKDGRIQQVGMPGEVYRRPANTFVARFIGAPSMNLLEGMAEGGRVTLASGGAVGTDRGATGPVLLGVRPDDLRPVEAGGLLEGRVAVSEPLGPETLLYVETPSGEVIAKADGRDPPPVGAAVRLGADPRDVHLFDRATGAALA